MQIQLVQILLLVRWLACENCSGGKPAYGDLLRVEVGEFAGEASVDLQGPAVDPPSSTVTGLHIGV